MTTVRRLSVDHLILVEPYKEASATQGSCGVKIAYYQLCD